MKSSTKQANQYALIAVVLSSSILLFYIASIKADVYDTFITTTTISTQEPSAPPTPPNLRAIEALDLIRDWALSFGRDIFYGTQEATCFRSIRDKFDPAKSDLPWKPSIESVDWQKTHAEIVTTISNTMSWHEDAVKRIAQVSEDLAGNHTFNSSLKYEYIDVHRLRSVDEVESEEAIPNDDSGSGEELVSDAQTDGQEEWQTKEAVLNLSKHKNFGDVLINTDESAVHVPVHIYPGDPQVMNGIGWSEQLTSTFKNNFMRNAKLTNQYFASQSGFLRLFPTQKWQILKSDPDLYDARMRPWYVAGASSRKDVIILVDSSGSMTGSRRDIAKGVVFEILDTLTDNDHFMILKFSDRVQQVGVPTCSGMRVEKRAPNIPAKNAIYQSFSSPPTNENDTDIESLFLVPATGRNIRNVKTNFTIPTSGIANFSQALVTAFEVLRNYQDTENLGSQCNQAIMLITDGSPSDFEDIFNRYNYPNAPLRVFTYLIGREAGDVTHTKMMACHNRGYYTHVINLAEVRETVQQYIPVMARPLVLNGSHPMAWTPAYGELTYQILTDWVWESKRRAKARNIIASTGRVESTGQNKPPDHNLQSNSNFGPDEEYFAMEEEYDTLDLFGYNNDVDCFWETHRNDLLTTVVQPVYDRKNESIITEKFLVKSTWTVKETLMRTAQILGVAAADMKINDIIALAPSHKLGPNGYAIMLTNNGYAMHHPDLRSILEPFGNDPTEKDMRIMKPFFASLDLTQVEHILDKKVDPDMLDLRKKAVEGKTGTGELRTKRSLDCQRRVQTRLQGFYYKPIKQYPFSFLIAIPQPYGSHRLNAMVETASPNLKQNLMKYFINTDYDLWVVHPEYRYCEGPSNNTMTTLIDVFRKIETSNTDDIWRPFESNNPPVLFPGQISCDKELVRSLIFDAMATYDFSRENGNPSPDAESSLLSMYGVRFSFMSTRSGLTRVRHYNLSDDSVKKEALAFVRRHGRAVDETYYKRTVDYNMLINSSAVLIQVPFNTHEKIKERFRSYETFESINLDYSLNANIEEPSNSGTKTSVKEMTFREKLAVLANKSIHAIATQTIVVKEGKQQAVSGVSGVFYDYASFVLRFFNATNSRYEDSRKKPASCFSDSPTDDICDSSKVIKCGDSNDTIDCLLVDNNGFIVVSEDLDFIGRHLKAYDQHILKQLLEVGIYHEVNITDYQSVCMRPEEKQTTSAALSSLLTPYKIIGNGVNLLFNNLVATLVYVWSFIMSLSNLAEAQSSIKQLPLIIQQESRSALLPSKTYLRPCLKTLTLYETRSGKPRPGGLYQYSSKCGCKSWFVYEQVPNTNLVMIIVDTTHACRHECDTIAKQTLGYNRDYNTINLGSVEQVSEEQVCSILERESQLYKKKLDSCFSHHPDEEHIKICGAATRSTSFNYFILIVSFYISMQLMSSSRIKLNSDRFLN